MSDETVFYIVGGVLAVSAVVVTFAGLKMKNFPGRALPVVILWFAVLAGGAATYSVLQAKEHEEAHAAEHHEAADIEEAESGPYENEGGALGGESEELEEEIEEGAGGGTDEEEPVGPTEGESEIESRGSQDDDGVLGTERESLEDQSEELEREGDVEVGEDDGK